MKALFNLKNKKLVQLKKAGFTLIELLVVLGIFSVIMSVALFNQAGLNSSIMITNLAYETALAVREAQTYGISVKSIAPTAVPSDINFDKGYGVYFDTSTVASQYQFLVFGDSNADNTYTQGYTPSEIQSLYEIKNQRGNKITRICVGNTNSGSNAIIPCNSTSVKKVDKLAIIFKRPNPEATFWVTDISGAVRRETNGPAVIVVNNADNSNCRAIIVEVTGQIRVENASGQNCTNGSL
jgi:prepilin-type N-terminal cleavage/methylation domain-containing protein